MTTLFSDLTDVNAEIRVLMMGLTPRSRASTRFYADKALEEGTAWEEIESRPRLFTIEWEPTGERITMGAAHYDAKFTGKISIWYPLHGWSLDALSDAEHIRDALKGITGSGGGGSSVTNCHFRLVDAENPVAVEPTEDGKWLQVPIVAVMTVQQS
jgi:hypothetical protein